jgi:hypothetical protein
VEVVSPELALVDPELRVWDLARHRYQSAAPPVRQPQVAALAQLQERTFTTRSAVLLVLVAATGMFAAWKITTPSSLPSHAPLTVRAKAASSVGRTAAALERGVLALVMRSPSARLPRRLIDHRTGLPSASLQATCARRGHSYLCFVRPYPHRSGEGMYVRYRPSAGGGTFTWYPYRAR